MTYGLVVVWMNISWFSSLNLVLWLEMNPDLATFNILYLNKAIGCAVKCLVNICANQKQ